MEVTGRVIVSLLHRDPQDEQGDTGGCICPIRCSRVNTYPGGRPTDGRTPWLGPLRKSTFPENSKKTQNNLTYLFFIKTYTYI